MEKKNPVVHFEMPYEDRERMSDFYSKTFGWTMQKMGEEMGGYVVAQTTETSADGMIKKPGNINGGFYKKSAENFLPSVVIAVDDIREAIKNVRANGGKIMGGAGGSEEPVEIPGIGMYISFIDTEGNRASLLQPKGM